VVEYEAGKGAARRGKARVPTSRWGPAGCGKGKRGNKKQKKKSNQPRVRAALAPRGVPIYPEVNWPGTKLGQFGPNSAHGSG
jgi:hypothetical protein